MNCINISLKPIYWKRSIIPGPYTRCASPLHKTRFNNKSLYRKYTINKGDSSLSLFKITQIVKHESHFTGIISDTWEGQEVPAIFVTPWICSEQKKRHTSSLPNVSPYFYIVISFKVVWVSFAILDCKK